ncbi:MAG TPA: hypothetical protein VJ907_02815 [Halanaerobiales bacterium]|nr:hypothetical protein [Halanaerobiales bacterium]
MAKKKPEEKRNRYFDIVLVLILLMVLATFIDLNITLEEVFGILIG